MLVQFDPYAEADNLASALFGAPEPSRRLSIDAVQRADHVELRCDLPGIDADSIAIGVDGDVLSVRAERRIGGDDTDHLLELECAQGVLGREVRLAEDLDPSGYESDYRDGVLTVRVPMAPRPAASHERSG